MHAARVPPQRRRRDRARPSIRKPTRSFLINRMPARFELYDGVAPSLNFAHGVSKFSFMEQERSFRPCVHHQHVGPKLLKIPNDFLALRMFIDKAEEIEVALGIADDTGVVAQLKQTDIAVI